MEAKQLNVISEARGSIVNMLRTSQQNHIQLTIMADNKAHILIAASFVTISVVSTRLVSSGWNSMFAILLLFAFLSALSATFSVMPRSQLEELGCDGFNILFFGHYTQLSMDEYLEEMNAILATDQNVYDRMLRDIYAMGCVLQRKYKFIRYSYMLFALGMASPVVYIIYEASVPAR